MDQKTVKPIIHLQIISWKNLESGEKLGGGSYGDVYKANWLEFKIEVAVKELHLKTLSQNLQKEFHNEAQIMAQCKFPHIVNLYGICNEGGRHGLVMEYMPKGSLRRVLEDKNEEISWDMRWEIAIDIGKGLAYLHSNNILHRDLKSLNVLLTADYHAKICDFGLSKLKLESSSTTTNNKAMGTTRWMAPELLSMEDDDTPAPTKASDVYSYAMVLWEISSREIPFKNAKNEIVAMGWIMNGKKEKIPEDSPKAYGDIIQECWLDAKSRPSTLDVLTKLTKAKPALIPIIPLSSPTLPVTPEKPQKIYLEKSWHFDPATERKAEKDNINPYQILEATERDKQKVISFYQHHPVQGYEIGSIKVIYNRDFNQGFEIQMRKLQQRNNNSTFTPKWSTENNPQWRAKTNDLFQKMTKPYTDNDYPAVKLLPLWHGTKIEVLDSIFRTGYANLATTDSGFFGNGHYGAHEAEYSHRVYGQGVHGAKGVLILNWVAIFSAYPVIDGDTNKLTGKSSYLNYDAHFIPVAPENPNKRNEKNYFPCKADQQHKYTEIVVFESSSCLPRYLIELQAISPQPNKLNSLQVQKLKIDEALTNQKKEILKIITGDMSLPQKNTSSPKILIITPEQLKKQNKLVDALLKNDLKSVQQLEVHGASFLYPNKEGLYPLAAAVYSTNLELVRYVECALKDKASKQWAEVDRDKAEKNLKSQVPPKLSKIPTYGELANWYKQNSSASWCNTYDEKILTGEKCDNWSTDCANWEKRGNWIIDDGLEDSIINPQGRFIDHGIGWLEKTKLYIPSLVVHNNVIKAISENMRVLTEDVKTKTVKQTQNQPVKTVNSAAFPAEVVSGSVDKTLKVWSFNTMVFDFTDLNPEQPAAFKRLFLASTKTDQEARLKLFGFFSTRDRKSFGCVSQSCHVVQKEMDTVYEKSFR